MPSTPAYDLVKDDQDLRLPLHAEEAFMQGISFQAKVNTYTHTEYGQARTHLHEKRTKNENTKNSQQMQLCCVHLCDADGGLAGAV